MQNPKASSTSNPPEAEGFHISNQPLVRSHGSAAAGNGASETKGSNVAGKDLLYVVARDPKSLFVYWDLNWTRLFAAASLTPCQVYLRVYRENGAIEGTHEINPFRGHHYAEVSAAGTGYYCELGCLAGEEWTRLIRSGKAITPADQMSDDLSAEFATLPLHLSFQRALDILRFTEAKGANLASRVAELQKAEPTQSDENGENEGHSDELDDLRTAAGAGFAPSAEETEQWRKIGEEFGGASWGGASESAPGGSSPA